MIPLDLKGRYWAWQVVCTNHSWPSVWQVENIVECLMRSDKTARELCAFLPGHVVPGREIMKLQGQDQAADGSQDSGYAEDHVVELGQQL